MKKTHLSMARQIAEAIGNFELRTGSYLPKSITVVMSDSTLVITLHGALSPVEQTLAQSASGADRLQEFHQALFANAPGSLRQEIKKITGMEVCEAATEIEPAAGAVAKVSTSGTVVHVLLLEGGVPTDTWSGMGPKAEDAEITKEPCLVCTDKRKSP
ncbi:MAG TPA: Na-translocating system protein MpsC family protein [Phycisphaerae bacterium]|nr:Na-translocating system protein MpsC family protein [Phycisphaerae bacterium]